MTIIKQHFSSKHFLFSLFALVLAAIIWIPSVHFLYKPDISEYRNNQEVPLKARMIVARHLEIWTNSVLQKIELQKMQQKNPEWDFMSRTYFVLALANIALVDKEFQQKACEIIDFIIDNTIEIEKNNGIYHFLLQYGHYDSWELNPPRSIFIDGEIAIMLAARRLISEKPSYKSLLVRGFGYIACIPSSRYKRVTCVRPIFISNLFKYLVPDRKVVKSSNNQELS